MYNTLQSFFFTIWKIGTFKNRHEELRKNQHLEIKYNLGEDGISMNEWDVRTERVTEPEDKWEDIP